VIPCLLLKGSGLVKTRQFADPKYVGDPYNAIRIFNEKSADELIVLDIEASRGGRGPNFEMIEQFAGECYMPVCYGGGVTTVEQAARILSLGVEKISIQSAALANFSLIHQIASRFGSQSVTLSVDVKRGRLGQDRLFASTRGKAEKRGWLEWMTAGVDAGAGEVLLTSVDHEGTSSGLDLTLIREASDAIPVPVIANGGVGSLTDIADGLSAGASAVAAGTYFVFHGPHRAVLITYLDEQSFIQLADCSM
jgi:cyclase